MFGNANLGANAANDDPDQDGLSNFMDLIRLKVIRAGL